MDVNEAFAQDCGGQWVGGMEGDSTWIGCGVCQACREIEDDERERRESDVPL